MNRTQKFLALFYGVATGLILLSHTVYGKGDPSLYLTFGVRATMVLAAWLLTTRLRERYLLRLAFLFTLVSDYFFILAQVFDESMPNRQLYGMLGFILSYLFLILAFSRQMKFGHRELMTFLPFGLIFLYLFMNLQKFATGFMLQAGIGIGVILSLAGMTMVSTLYRGLYTRRAAWMIALAGFLMFFSDLFVAYSIYDPAFANFMLWKENLIWGTYVPAWTLLLLLMAEDRPYLEVQNHGRQILTARL